MDLEIALKEIKETKEKAKKYGKKYGQPIPLVSLPADVQWETILSRLDLWGFKLVKKEKK